MSRQQTKVSNQNKTTFKEHIQACEDFINGTDDVGRLLDDLRHRVSQHGIASLSTPERLYFAVDEFYCAITNGCVVDLHVSPKNEILHYTTQAFRQLGDQALERQMEKLVEVLGDDTLDEFSDVITDAVDPFVIDQQEICERIDSYAKAQGLL